MTSIFNSNESAEPYQALTDDGVATDGEIEAVLRSLPDAGSRESDAKTYKSSLNGKRQRFKKLQRLRRRRPIKKGIQREVSRLFATCLASKFDIQHVRVRLQRKLAERFGVWSCSDENDEDLVHFTSAPSSEPYINTDPGCRSEDNVTAITGSSSPPGNLDVITTQKHVFIFNFGVLLFWGTSTSFEGTVIQCIQDVSRELDRNEIFDDQEFCDEMSFTHSWSSKVLNDLITLGSADVSEKLAVLRESLARSCRDTCQFKVFHPS